MVKGGRGISRANGTNLEDQGSSNIKLQTPMEAEIHKKVLKRLGGGDGVGDL